MAKANKLTKLDVDEVSLVDSPANPGAHVLLWKRKDGNGDYLAREALVKQVLAKLNLYGPGSDESKTFASMREDGENQELVSVLCQSLNNIIGDSESTPEEKLALVETSLGEFLSALQDGDESGELPEGDMAMGKSKISNSSQEDDVTVDPNKDKVDPAVAKAAQDVAAQEQIEKAMQPLKKQLEDMTKALEASNVEISKQQEVIAKAERIEKAKAMVGDLASVNVDDVADMLKSLPVDQAEKLAGVLKAAGEQAKLATILETRGSNMVVKAGSAVSIAKARSEELRKSDPKLTEQAAMTKVWANDPALYDKYVAETN